MSNLVLNGNFATNNFNNWQGDTGIPNKVYVETPPTPNYADLYSGSIFQPNIPTTPGSYYLLSYRLQLTGVKSNRSFYASINDVKIVASEINGEIDDFSFRSEGPFRFLASTASTSLKFTFDGGNGAFGLTDISIVLAPTPICFKENTKISCLKDNIETDIYIQNLRSGDLVKTCKNGYLPVNVVGRDICYNPKNNIRLKSRLFKLKKENYPSLKEDLIVTGCHSILVPNLSSKEEEEIIKDYGNIYVTDEMYRLPAYLDDRSDIYKDECGEINVYHVALGENERKNYGIYANGLLVESCFIPRVKNEMTLLE